MRFKSYHVTKPEIIETLIQEDNLEISEGYVKLKTHYTSACKSDLRYFFGRRPKKVLNSKYPLALFHEGIAIVQTAGKKLKIGDKVIVIPNIPCFFRKDYSKCDYCKSSTDSNYCNDSFFISSNAPGMSKNIFTHPEGCLLKVPVDVPDLIAVFAELLSVSVQAQKQVYFTPNLNIAVFGGGPTGFLQLIALRFLQKIKKEHVVIFDISKEIRERASTLALPFDPSKFKQKNHFDIIFECVGKEASEKAINKSIDLLKPKGTLVLLGVSEKKVRINTRDILEKGLRVIGSSRSCIDDYPTTLEILANKEAQNEIEKIIDPKIYTIQAQKDLEAMLYRADKSNKKIIAKW